MMWPEVEPEDRRRTALWVGLGASGAFMLIGMLGPNAGSIWRVPGVLKQRIAAELSADGYAGLDVQMRGQDALLSGIVGTEADIAKAQRVAQTAAGAGGLWAGGVTRVDVRSVKVGAFERPFVWIARREGRRVVLRGAVPSEIARRTLLTTAQQTFQNAEAVDEMRVAGGAPSPVFSDIAKSALRDLRRLRSGEVRVTDAQVAFVGEGAYQDIETLKRNYADAPAPFRVRVDVLTDGLDLAHPELQGVNFFTGGADACAQAFSRLTERANLRFTGATEAVDPASRTLLDSLTSVALRCDHYTITIAGPAQGGGDLSRRRAQAIAAYFTGQGVSPARLNSVAGEAAGVTFNVAS